MSVSKLVLYSFLNRSSGALVGVGGSDFNTTRFKIPQRGVQWKQGVVIYMISYTSLSYNATPIRCTPLPLHPPCNEYPELGCGDSRQLPCAGFSWAALLVQRYLSNMASFVFYGITCLIRLIEFATGFATFEESQCQTGSLRQFLV